MKTSLNVFFAAWAIVLFAAVAYLLIWWLGWTGWLCVIGASIILSIVVISIVTSSQKK